MFVLCMETTILDYADRKCLKLYHFSNFFQLMPVLFSCAVSDFLYEEFSAMPIRAYITFMLFPMRIFLLILVVLLRIKIHDKSKTFR